MNRSLPLLSLLMVLIAYGCTPGQPDDRELMIIAHRGGVVDHQHSENSFEALEAAIEQGYTHVEVDARITKDGHVVCFHNDELWEEAGINGKISELPLDSVTQIILTRSQEPIPTFAEYAARCTGRIGLMVDLKGCEDRYIDQYAREIEDALAAQGLLQDALLLINKIPKNNQDKIVEKFAGKARVSWRRSLKETKAAASQDPAFAQKYYVFNHGADFSKEDVQGFQQLGLKVIVSVNVGHYRDVDHRRLAEEHLRRAIDWGMDGVQIDSEYDAWVF